MKIRPIHPFGPAVGKWKSHGTVAETIARVKRELKDDAHREALLRESVGQKVTKIGAKHGRG